MSTKSKQARRDPATPLVRPRMVWAGLLVALAGALALTIAFIDGSTTTGAIGVVVLVAGAVGGIRGGVLYDASGGGPLGEEMRHLVTGQTRAGVMPGQMLRPPRVEARALVAARPPRLRVRRERPRLGRLDVPAGGAMLVAATVLIWSQWAFVTDSTTGRTDSYRDTGLAVVLGLAGLRCAFSSSRHRIAGAVAMLGGACLLAQGILAAHTGIGLGVVEYACGGIAVIAGAVTLATSAATSDTATAVPGDHGVERASVTGGDE